MLKTSLLTLLFNFLFLSIAFGQEVPKNIIVIEEDLENNNDLQENNENISENTDIEQTVNEQDSESDLLNEQKVEQSAIIIDDIPKEFNEWYGILSSQDGGLGWSMWGNTDQEFALNLMKKTNFRTTSPTLFELTSSFILSRAKKPMISKISPEQIQSDIFNDPFLYFKKKLKS